nr:acyl-CoA synthetase [Pseudomonas sp.]
MNQPAYLGDHAALTPDKPAVIMAGTGAARTYREVDEASNRLAHHLYEIGLRRGDHIAILMENNIRYLDVCWAAIRSGLIITPVNRFLTPGEADYILQDCGAQVLISSHAMAELAGSLQATQGMRSLLMVDGTIPGWQDLDSSIEGCPPTPLAEEWLGTIMLYSSGTTGRPKGILRGLTGGKVQEGITIQQVLRRYRLSQDSVYLCPAPLYHAAPVTYAIGAHFEGATVVVMDKFEPLEALRAIERYGVTHSQWVPTMFIRMLRLPQEERERFDLSSHQVAVHAAAPCPVAIKQRMIEWWGPILQEYYAGTEGNGFTDIDSHDWLKHPGSVGRALIGELHICDENGNELPPNEPGLIYFAQPQLPFTYHNAPEKTQSAQHPIHPNWTTLGDIGKVDEEGYLYLTDRKAFMIISGGVNIYPQQVEDALMQHPDVVDAGVIGVPDEEMGEAVKAIIEPVPERSRDAGFVQELTEFVRARVARYMVPRSIDFVDEMPRLATGKLNKFALRDQFGQALTKAQST